MLSLGVWICSWLDTSQFAQVLSFTQTPSGDTSASDELVDFPVSEKALKAKEDLQRVNHYLHSLRLPSDISDTASARLLRMAACFFLLNGRLWRRQHHGRHQLYIPPSQQLHLIRDAHDNLGHKGFYSTQRTLLDRFWWPALQQNIKWFIDTCHQCQLHQTTKVRIPPTVALPAPLFRKKPTLTQCSCPQPLASATSSRLVAPLLHGLSGMPFTQRRAALLEPSSSKNSGAGGEPSNRS